MLYTKLYKYPPVLCKIKKDWTTAQQYKKAIKLSNYSVEVLHKLNKENIAEASNVPYILC